MSVLAIVLIVLGVLVVVLAIGGTIAAGRIQQRSEAHLRQVLEQANEALAQARALDRGWERATLEAAAREAAGSGYERLELVQVVDNPGVENDKAVFKVIVKGGRDRTITLGRRDGAWVAD
jgi:sensor histidine kinase regulating citrate/malate metabolism